jgi:hypothetical protein
VGDHEQAFLTPFTRREGEERRRTGRQCVKGLAAVGRTVDVDDDVAHDAGHLGNEGRTGPSFKNPKASFAHEWARQDGPREFVRHNAGTLLGSMKIARDYHRDALTFQGTRDGCDVRATFGREARLIFVTLNQ